MNHSKLIYIIRHGQTDYNKRGIIQGSGVDSELNELGKMQAKAFFDYYKDELFDQIYSSQLIRCRQSVKLFEQNGSIIQTHFGLNEINWGIYEGKVADRTMIQHYRRILKEWKNGNYDLQIEGGESPQQLQDRQKQAVALIMKNVHEKRVLISSHGRALRSLLCLLLKRPLSDMDQFEHSNLCLYKLGYNGQEFKLLNSNSTEHLNGIRSS